jgi:hypothetical protein
VPDGVAMSELSNGTKKHTSKSRETIPLNENHKSLRNKKIKQYTVLCMLMKNEWKGEGLLLFRGQNNILAFYIRKINL